MGKNSGLRWRATTQTAQGVIDIHWLNVESESSTEQVSAAISKTINAVAESRRDDGRNPRSGSHQGNPRHVGGADIGH